MRAKMLLGLLLLAVNVAFGAQPPSLKPPSRWIQLSSQNLEIDGLPWYAENHGELFRLPIRLQDTYPKSVWNLAKDPSGGRIRFRTDSSALAIRLEYPSPPGMQNMHAFGQSGVDLYIDNTYWDTAVADKNARPGKVYEHVYFNFGDAPRAERDITLYLPLYIGVKVLALGIDEDAVIKPPRPFAISKPVVFYGTSITQGGCASRPGMSYEAIVGRRLNLDFVNLGFSGAGKYEASMAQAVASIDAICYVLDGSNIRTVEEMRTVFAPFIRLIRAKRPDTPILAISPLYSSQELNDRDRKLRDETRRDFTRDVVSRFIANGDKNIQVIEGTDLLSPLQGDGLTDGAHPNDLGFEWIANGIARRLAAVLGLNSQRW
jgi:lysophospholipase L1-like esterase